jgi:hypothetical protein
MFGSPGPTSAIFSAGFLRDHHRSHREAIQRQGERVVAHYGNRDRERQKREEREGREAIAREVAERNRRNGWPY